MRGLVPEPDAEIDPFEAYGRTAPVDGRRTAVRLNMIASVDGAVAIDGRSGGLGGPADRAVFSALRALTDAVLVGATTVREERYGPVRFTPEQKSRRRELGLLETAPIAVLTRSCRLDWETPFFAAAEARPIILTTASADPRDTERASRVADVVIVGENDVDPQSALDALAERGSESILLEGGPHLNGQLAAAGLVDEICLSLAPLLVGGDSGRILAGAGLDHPSSFELLHVLEADGYLFLRYRRL